VQRDRETEAHLADLGWTSIRVWEHEESALAVQRIVEVLQAATPADNDLV
jgi:DNA mismatch endonuclease (patch repair protein)